MDDDSLSDFRALLRRESQRRTGTLISSGTPAQAAVVMEVLFATAQEAVRIVTGGLNARIYGHENVIVEAKKFLTDKSRSLTIIFLSKPDPMITRIHPLLASLRYNDNVRVLQAAPETVEVGPPHFTVVDKDAFRLKRDAFSHGAIVAFGDKTLSGTLLKMFSLLEGRGRDIEILEPA
jgi:hypothetical protein